MPISVVNLQKSIDIDTKAVREFVNISRSMVPAAVDRSITVAFIDDARMKELNELFRGKSSTTDVLSFPHEPDEFDPDKSNLGDIVISAEQAKKQAGDNGLTFDVEIKQLILHGLLHLCGYDHETDDGDMNAIELRLRQKALIES